MKKRWIVLPSVLAVMVALPFFVNAFEQTGDLEYDRARSEDSFVTLSEGITHYTRSGPSSESCVILIHGVSGPMSGWQKTLPALAEAGHKVIAYDLFGRGLSDRPNVTYDRAFYRKQLKELLNETGCRNGTSLVGSSMGAIIAADFATSHPEHVRRVVLIGPAGFEIEATAAASLMQIPVIGEYGIAVGGRNSLKKHNEKYYWKPELWPEAASAFVEQFRYPGYKRAVLSTMRNMPVEDFKSGYSDLRKTDIETMLIWGRLDQTFPYQHFDKAKALIAPIRAETIEAAAHVPQYEQADEVNGILVEFLQPV